MSRLASLILLAAFALATMGQDGCSTDPDRDGRQRDRGATSKRQPQPKPSPKPKPAAPAASQSSPQPAPPPEPEPEPQPTSNCEQGYDPCVPTYPPDLDCPDVGPVTVTGADPHALDADGDGSACEY